MGIGYDAHRLVSGRPLILGGVNVPYALGLEGHSDADVLSHAVADALLGAAGLGDLGQVFPSSEPRFRGASSLVLLREVAARVRGSGYDIVNVDAVVVADAPHLEPFRSAMRANLAAALEVAIADVNLKPKSNEGLGFEGEGRGMSARAVALLRERRAP